MDSSTATSPLRWIPWLLAALAALAALCLLQLYQLQRTENSLLREQLALSDAAAASLRNQLEAERLLARHPLSAPPVSSPAAPAVEVVSPPAPATRN